MENKKILLTDATGFIEFYLASLFKPNTSIQDTMAKFVD